MTHETRRRSFVSEKDENGNRVWSVNNLKKWQAIGGFFLTLASILTVVWGTVKWTVTSVIDSRISHAIAIAKPEMVSAAEQSHNAIRHDLNVRIDSLEKQQNIDRESTREGQQRIEAKLIEVSADVKEINIFLRNRRQ